MLTAIVADDEKLARRRLVRLIEETGDAEIVAACAGGREAVGETIARQPNLLFLDVQMPDLDGFGVLREISGKASPATIFVTAFDQYAVRAFEVHAVDYLLKPFDTGRFLDAFGRARDRVTSAAGSGAVRASEDDRMRALLADYVASVQTAHDAPGGQGAPAAARPSLDRVAVRSDGVLKVIRTADVDWLETD